VSWGVGVVLCGGGGFCGEGLFLGFGDVDVFDAVEDVFDVGLYEVFNVVVYDDVFDVDVITVYMGDVMVVVVEIRDAVIEIGFVVEKVEINLVVEVVEIGLVVEAAKQKKYGQQSIDKIHR
jgi:hypothetical protein